MTGELSVSYMGVGIKGGGGAGVPAPHFPAIVVYQSLYRIWVWLDALYFMPHTTSCMNAKLTLSTTFVLLW